MPRDRLDRRRHLAGLRGRDPPTRPADTGIVLLHVTDPDVADVAHGAYAGLLGRGQPRRDPGAQLENLAWRPRDTCSTRPPRD